MLHHFDPVFERTVAPKLDHIGFRMIPEPKGWIIPSKLYERDNVWFGADWDWRDCYLAVTVGRLFRIRDFLPRAIVRGPYHHEATAQREDIDRFLATHLGRVARELPDAVAHAVERWPATPALEKERWERSTGGAAAYAKYLSYLGGELTLANWPESRVP